MHTADRRRCPAYAFINEIILSLPGVRSAFVPFFGIEVQVLFADPAAFSDTEEFIFIAIDAEIDLRWQVSTGIDLFASHYPAPRFANSAGYLRI